MKEIFYYEMRKRIEEIRALDPKNVESDGVYPVSEKDMMLLDTVSEMIELSRIATKEGLLTLEEKSLEYKNAPAGKYLSHLITLVADCTPPEELEEIAYCRYFSSGLSDYGALQYLIMLYGILAVQRGENAFRLERKIIYLLPEELADEYLRRKKVEKEEERAKRKSPDYKEDVDLSILDKVCEGELAVDPADDYFYVINLTDQVINAVDDKAIQRLLRDVENSDLVTLMKAVSGDARRRIFDNMSSRLSVMIAEDLLNTGKVKLEDVGKAAQKIFRVFLKLIEAGQIVYNEDLMLREMANVFLIKEDDRASSSSTITETENKLNGLWKEYLSHSHKLIDLPCKVQN